MWTRESKILIRWSYYTTGNLGSPGIRTEAHLYCFQRGSVFGCESDQGRELQAAANSRKAVNFTITGSNDGPSGSNNTCCTCQKYKYIANGFGFMTPIRLDTLKICDDHCAPGIVGRAAAVLNSATSTWLLLLKINPYPGTTISFGVAGRKRCWK